VGEDLFAEKCKAEQNTRVNSE